MSNNKYSLNNIIASIILGLSAIILISLLWIWVIKAPKTDRIPGKITIELHSDSTLVMSAEDRTVIIDSLNTIMQRREQLLANKYQYAIEKRAIEDSLFSIGSILVGIIIAILGFFGFKSFQTIEDKAHQIAKETAKATAEETAKTEAQIYLNNNIRSNVIGAIEEKFITEIKNSIAVSLKNDIIDQLREEMSDFINHQETYEVDEEKLTQQKEGANPTSETGNAVVLSEDKILNPFESEE